MGGWGYIGLDTGNEIGHVFPSDIVIFVLSESTDVYNSIHWQASTLSNTLEANSRHQQQS